jgi:hypothetical protein
MTHTEAAAILDCRRKIQAALARCRKSLKGDELIYADNYWMAHIRQSISGGSYGSAPIARAEKVLEEHDFFK